MNLKRIWRYKLQKNAWKLKWSAKYIIKWLCYFFFIAAELQSTEATPAARTLGPADVFVSYCWVNSEKAHKAKQVSTWR